MLCPCDNHNECDTFTHDDYGGHWSECRCSGCRSVGEISPSDVCTCPLCSLTTWLQKKLF
jgi:hypothetical protein